MGFVPKGTLINALLKPMIFFSKGKNVDHVNYDKTFPELRETLKVEKAQLLFFHHPLTHTF